MKNKVRHVLGISGGKDSAALAIYLKNKYPQLSIEYYFCDTGKELDETYEVIENLEIYLGRKIDRLQAAPNSHEAPFDHFIQLKGGFLPSSFNRWCTKNLKLDPFEKWVKDDPVISYVGIRADEDREGYISRKPTIQSIFPFRGNIWSEDVISKVLRNENIPLLSLLYEHQFGGRSSRRIMTIVQEHLSTKFCQKDKLNSLMSLGISDFNRVVFQYLKTTSYPLASEDDFVLLDNEDLLTRDNIFQILIDSGVGIPKYYEKIEFEVNGKQGEYSRSRSGCFFCFFQQKIEWVWLKEQHPDKFDEAMKYEREGYTWVQGESLQDLMDPARMSQIKEEYIQRMSKSHQNRSPYLLDLLEDSEGEGCAACFI